MKVVLHRTGRDGVDANAFRRKLLQTLGDGGDHGLFNHANLGRPGTTYNSTTFGVITSASSPRIVQVALKLVF